MDLRRWLAQDAPDFALAIQFLTRLPVPEVEFSEAAAKRSVGWYPLVGLLVGAVTAGVFCLAALVVPQVMAALIAAAAGLMLTGALHEDGLADLCDGLGGSRGDPARALAIMRDSAIGAYGALGLGMALALRITALATLPVWAVPVALIVGATVSRASMVRAMSGADYVRPQGAGSAVAGAMAEAVLQRALITAVAVAVLGWPLLGFWAGICGAMGVAAAHLGLRRIYESRLGGYTGDCLGAVQIVSEVGFVVGLMVGI